MLSLIYKIDSRPLDFDVWRFIFRTRMLIMVLNKSLHCRMKPLACNLGPSLPQTNFSSKTEW